MKRFLILGVFTVAFATMSIQEASAWINSNFGLGLNWNWQSGGNSFCGGLFRDGQPCGPDMVPSHVPVYPRPCCCQAGVVQVPQIVCPPGAGAQAPLPGVGPGGPGGPVQAFRYSYRPAPGYYYGR